MDAVRRVDDDDDPVDNGGMLRRPHNRREFWTLVRRLLALLALVGACLGGYGVLPYVIAPTGARND